MDIVDIFSPDTLFAPPLCTMHKEGAAHVASALHENFRRSLADELRCGPFRTAEETVGMVRQKFERFAFLDRAEKFPNLERLRITTETLVRGTGACIPALDTWRIRDIVAQRYHKDGFLGAHRDLKRHTGVIAIYTITGTAVFELLGATRDAPPVKTFRLRAGDLVFLRGTGLTDMNSDERPFHRVGGSLSDEPRICLSFRDNNNVDEPIPGFFYCNRTGGA